MTYSILLAAIVVISCVLLNKLSQKIGIPMLLAFIVLGMVFGTDGILKIPFENYDFSERVCSVALIFIMFYGGFGTSWRQARPVAVFAALLSTLGVVLTAGLTGLFCFYLLKIDFLESMLVGAVVSSTDAASVFSILRSKRLGLKEHTDSLLELESGSNDPCSYMLTVVVLTLMGGGISGGAITWLLFSQFVFGILAGTATALAAVCVLRRFRFETAGFDMAFVIGIALFSYALAGIAGGNGYLSVYLCGIILGNAKFQNKKALVHFFDGLTGLMQMVIFFLLGLLATPSRIPAVFLTALGVMLFLTFAARPLSVFALLSPFRRGIRQQLLVSFAGLRGAASIVFAVMAVVKYPSLNNDLFHIVFCIVLMSILFQGSLLPGCARWLEMSDAALDVMKTFNDYSEEVELEFTKVRIPRDHPWAGSAVSDITLPPETLIAMIFRGGRRLVPDGKTVLQERDALILCSREYRDEQGLYLQEQKIPQDSEWVGRTIHEYSPRQGELVIMIIRDDKVVVPEGRTVIEKGDILVINSAPSD